MGIPDEEIGRLRLKNAELKRTLQKIANMKNLGMVTDAVIEMQRLAREALK